MLGWIVAEFSSESLIRQKATFGICCSDDLQCLAGFLMLNGTHADPLKRPIAGVAPVRPTTEVSGEAFSGAIAQELHKAKTACRAETHASR